MTESRLLARSREEVGHVARWYADHRGRNERPPSLLLIGGWAVYQYNPYTMSRDIDIIVNSDTRRSLVRWLRSERGAERSSEPMLPSWKPRVALNAQTTNWPSHGKRPRRRALSRSSSSPM